MKPRLLFAAVLAVLLLPLAPVAMAEQYDLAPTAPDDQVYQVEVELKVGGELTLRDPGANGKAGKAEELRRLPMSVAGKLGYEEQRLDGERTLRYYNTAEATIKVDKGGKSPRLPESRRLSVTRTTPGHVILASPDGPLSREELDLIDVAGASTLLDGLLPGKKLPESESWQVPAEVMGALLGLDSVEICEVSNVVDEGNASYVKFQIAGLVHGRAEGAESEFDLRGLGLFSRRWGCVTQLNLAVKEIRKVGPATPGFDGVAKINIKRTPIDKAEHLSSERIARAKAAQDAPTDLILPAEELGFEVSHDRGWFLASETRTTLSMRRVAEGKLVAQATFTRIPSKSIERQPTLDQFENDVKLGLGKSLTEVVSSEEWSNRAGLHCLGVAARGRVQDLELEWRHYLTLPDAEGHSVSLTVTLAVDDRAAVANSDKLLAEALRLTTPVRKEVASKGDSNLK
jgi:hypothetical protein